MSEPTYSVVQAGLLLRLHDTTIRAHCASGYLRAERVPGMGRGGWHWAIPASAIAAYSTRRDAPKPSKPTPLPAPAKPQPLPYAPYMAAMATASGRTLAAITGRDRRPDVLEARHVLAYLLHVDAGYGVTAVGLLLDRDHSTIIHAIGKVTEHATYEMRYLLEECRRLVAQKTERKEKAG